MRSRRPEDHPRWKDGITINARGYRLVRAHWHPRAGKDGYVPEHVLVWEKYNGMPVPEGCIVHHLNGVKDDNRPKNLVCFPRHNHSPQTLLDLCRKRIRELEAIIAQQALPLE